MSNVKPHSRQKSLKSLAKEESQKSIFGLIRSQSNKSVLILNLTTSSFPGPPSMTKQKIKREYTAVNSEMETQSKPTSPLRTWNLSTDLSKASFNVLDKTNETRQRHRSPFYDRTAEEVTYLKLAVKARLNKSKERGDYRNFFNDSPPPVPEINVYRRPSPQRSPPLKKSESNQRSRKDFAATAEEEELKIKHTITAVSPDAKKRAKLISKDRGEVGNLQVSPMKTNKSTTAFHFMSQETTEHDLSPFSPIPIPKRGGNHMRHSSTVTQFRHSRNGSDARIRHVQSLEVSFSGENKRYKTAYDNDDKESSYTRDLSPFRENRPSYDEKMLSPLSKTEKTENLKEALPIVLQKNFKVSRGGSDGNIIFQRGAVRGVDREAFSPIKFCGDFGDIDESISFLSGHQNRISSSPGIKNNELKHKIEKIIETKKSRKTPPPVVAADLNQNGNNLPTKADISSSELKKKKVPPKRGGSSNDLNSHKKGSEKKPFSVMQHLMKTLNKNPKSLTEENTTPVHQKKYNREGVFSPSRLEKINASHTAKKSGNKDQRSQSKLKANNQSNLKKPSKKSTTKDETIMLSKILKVKNLVEPQTEFNDMMTLSVDYREGQQEEEMRNASSKTMDDQSPSFDFSQIPKILDDKTIPGESKDGEKSNPREELEEVLKNSDLQQQQARELVERKKRKEGTKIKPSIFKTQVSESGKVASSLESTELHTTTPNATEEFKTEEEEEKVKRAARRNPRVDSLKKEDSMNFSDSPSSDRVDLKEVWTSFPLDKPLLINKPSEEGPYDIAMLFEENITRFETFKKFGNVAASIKLLNEITQELETFESKYLEITSNKPEVEANLLSFKIQTRNKLALELYLSKDYQASLEQSQKVLEIDRCNIQAIYKSFQAYTKLGEKKKAKELLKRIQKLMQIPALVQHNQKFMLDDMSFNSNSNSQSSRRSQSLEDSQDVNASTISSLEN